MTDNDNNHGMPRKVAIVCSKGSLDMAYPGLILANAARMMGIEAMVFFTFWGLSILKKPGSGITGEDWRQKLMSAFHKGTPDGLHLSKLHFAGLGPSMMKSLADDKNVASVQELLDLSQQLGVKLWPCQMTMDLMGLTNDDLIDGLDKPAGAGSAISLMKEASIQLFV